jgi:flagellar protein FlaJ
MVSVLTFVPLLFAALVIAIVPLAQSRPEWDRRLSRVSRWFFGRYVGEVSEERERMLRAAYIETTYRGYASKSYFYALLAAVAGGIIAAYVTGGFVAIIDVIGEVLGQLPDPMGDAFAAVFTQPDLSQTQLLALVLGGGVLGGGVSGVGAYLYRWQMPKSTIEVRRRGINEGLPRTTAFIYALSRGGMEIPQTLRILSRNREVYGDTADELTLAIREIDLFGADVINAISRVSERTPSDQFKTFTENFASVLQSGQSVTDFLQEQYERYQEESAERQREILELLATIAEGYVTVLVAGVLFLITILLVFGLTTSNTLGLLQMLTYVFVPLANVGFMLYLDQQLQMLGIVHSSVVGNLENQLSSKWRPEPASTTRSDGGHERRNALKQLRQYDTISRFKRIARQPLQTLLWNPTIAFYVSVPLALLLIALRAPAAFGTDAIAVRTLDDVVVQSMLLVLGSFAVTWELYRRRLRRIENSTPELLERLASLNEAGMSVIESFNRVRGTELGVLSEEVERIWRDVTLGANVADALRRFGLRIRTASITRAVTLITNAMGASGNLGPVLRIAAKQAQSDLKLRRQRRQQMLTYLVVIYISFFVFLVIIVSVHEVLVPSLPNNVPTPSDSQQLGVGAGQFTRLGSVDKPAYTLVFFHTALVQAICSGFIAGQLGEGTLKDGTKHATIMLGIAYVAFLLLSSPVASLTFADQASADRTVTVDDVSLSNGGYVVVRANAGDGPIVGHSEYLQPGTHDSVEIAINTGIGDERQLYAVPHLDTNGNRQFDYTEGATVDGPYPSKLTAPSDPATITRADSESSLRPPRLLGRPSPRP